MKISLQNNFILFSFFFITSWPILNKNNYRTNLVSLTATYYRTHIDTANCYIMQANRSRHDSRELVVLLIRVDSVSVVPCSFDRSSLNATTSVPVNSFDDPLTRPHPTSSLRSRLHWTRTGNKSTSPASTDRVRCQKRQRDILRRNSSDIDRRGRSVPDHAMTSQRETVS